MFASELHISAPIVQISKRKSCPYSGCQGA